MKKIIVLTGAGVSAESGIKTFRDSDGLWENYNIMDVATPEAWAKNPKLVLDFYNQRRKQVIDAQPNEAHKLLVKLEEQYDVQIITQNVDDLHERAGSSKILHLHGEILKARSSVDESDIYEIKNGKIEWGETCKLSSQIRPHIVWFGEMVPNIPIAEKLTKDADILLIIGTSLAVYPAAGLVNFAPLHSRKILIDPNDVTLPEITNLSIIKEKASIGMTILAKELLNY